MIFISKNLFSLFQIYKNRKFNHLNQMRYLLMRKGEVFISLQTSTKSLHIAVVHSNLRKRIVLEEIRARQDLP